MMPGALDIVATPPAGVERNLIMRTRVFDGKHTIGFHVNQHRCVTHGDGPAPARIQIFDSPEDHPHNRGYFGQR
jgi:hypothetical protein